MATSVLFLVKKMFGICAIKFENQTQENYLNTTLFLSRIEQGR